MQRCQLLIDFALYLMALCFPQLKSVGPKLVPSFKTVAVYFVLLNPTERASPMVALWKCLPVVSLVLFVYLHGISLANE